LFSNFQAPNWVPSKSINMVNKPSTISVPRKEIKQCVASMYRISNHANKYSSTFTL
jgi:hypothetical protein